MYPPAGKARQEVKFLCQIHYLNAKARFFVLTICCLATIQLLHFCGPGRFCTHATTQLPATQEYIEGQKVSKADQLMGIDMAKHVTLANKLNKMRADILKELGDSISTERRAPQRDASTTGPDELDANGVRSKRRPLAAAGKGR